MADKYFRDLNYSLGNEDTGLEVEMVGKLRPKNIFSVAGCGSRALPLLACSPEHLVAVDISNAQIYITELRLASYQSFSHQEFLKFWGFMPYGTQDYSHWRKEAFLRLGLSEKCREYFTYLFEKNKYQSILYAGKWEKTFKILARALRVIMGKKFDEIFSFHDLSEQIRFYSNNFSMKKWKSIIFLLGNKSVFNALLYKGEFIKKNVPESFFDYYFESFETLFNNRLARESFFANLCFYGQIHHEDANTIEAKEDNYRMVQEALKQGSEVSLENMDIFKALEKDRGYQFDFVSLSDVPSYFSGETEKTFMQTIKKHLSPGAIVVLRNYLREPDADLSDFIDISVRFTDELARESVQMYRIKIYEYSPN